MIAQFHTFNKLTNVAIFWIDSQISFNLLVANVLQFGTLGQNYDFKIRKDNWNFSFERRTYESVDDRSLHSSVTKKG